MEVDNTVFGSKAEDADNSEEKFSFSNRNKDISKDSIDKSAKEFAEFMISVSADTPDLTDEEINSGVVKILEKSFPAEEENQPLKNNKFRKITLRVLFVAALLSAIAFSSVCVIGNSNDISIENGFMTFARDTIKITFFGEEKEEYISVDSLLRSLEENGYGDILFPEEFVVKSDIYKADAPVYNSDVVNDLTFDIYNDTMKSTFLVSKHERQRPRTFLDLKNAKTEIINGMNVYVLEFESGMSLEFISGEYQYYITSDMSYDDMISLTESMKSVKDIK